MKNIKLFLLVAFILCFVTKSFSQHGRYDIHNGIDITGAITKFNINTDNFVTRQGDGFLFGLAGMVNLSHKWYNISVGLQFSQNTIGILGSSTGSSLDEGFIDYKLLVVQMPLLFHIKPIKNFCTIDLGPVIQYGDGLELKKTSNESYYVAGYDNVLASDITHISQLNINGLIGVSAGYRFVKLKAHYMHGFNNILEKLNSKDLDTTGGNANFKGNLNMLVLGVMFTF